MEREVFLKLRTDRERDLFIEAFWKQRDPTPGSDANELRTEHLRRIAYADRYYGRDAPRPDDEGAVFYPQLQPVAGADAQLLAEASSLRRK